MAGPTLDVTRDYLALHNTQAVTLERDSGAGNVAVTCALETAVNENDLLGGVISDITEATIWVIWVADLQDGEAGAVVEKNDVIIHGTDRWKIRNFSLRTLRSRYRCVCTKEKSNG